MGTQHPIDEHLFRNLRKSDIASFGKTRLLFFPPVCLASVLVFVPTFAFGSLASRREWRNWISWAAISDTTVCDNDILPCHFYVLSAQFLRTCTFFFQFLLYRILSFDLSFSSPSILDLYETEDLELMLSGHGKVSWTVTLIV